MNKFVTTHMKKKKANTISSMDEQEPTLNNVPDFEAEETVKPIKKKGRFALLFDDRLHKTVGLVLVLFALYTLFAIER